MSNEFHNPPQLFDSRPYGFSQIAVASGSKTIYMSGQVGWDESMQIVDPDDLRAQAFKALENVSIGLQSVGASLADVVSMRIYILDRVMDQDGAVSEALLHYFDNGRLPNASFIGVPSLANKDFLIEIEPIAVVA